MSDEAKQPAQPDGPTHGASPRGSVPDASPGRRGFRWSRLLMLPFRSTTFLLATLAALMGGGVLAYGAMERGSVDGLALDAAPWSLRVGVSFMAAFVFAWLLRLAIKLALLVGGVLIGVAVLLHWLGLGISAEQVESIKQGVEESAATITAQGDHWWAMAKSYLPSGGAAGLGLWKGARHDA